MECIYRNRLNHIVCVYRCLNSECIEYGLECKNEKECRSRFVIEKNCRNCSKFRTDEPCRGYGLCTDSVHGGNVYCLAPCKNWAQIMDNEPLSGKIESCECDNCVFATESDLRTCTNKNSPHFTENMAGREGCMEYRKRKKWRNYNGIYSYGTAKHHA